MHQSCTLGTFRNILEGTTCTWGEPGEHRRLSSTLQSVYPSICCSMKPIDLTNIQSFYTNSSIHRSIIPSFLQSVTPLNISTLQSYTRLYNLCAAPSIHRPINQSIHQLLHQSHTLTTFRKILEGTMCTWGEHGEQRRPSSILQSYNYFYHQRAAPSIHRSINPLIHQNPTRRAPSGTSCQARRARRATTSVIRPFNPSTR